MIYNVLIGIVVGIIISVIIVGICCVMLIAGREDRDYPKKGKK